LRAFPREATRTFGARHGLAWKEGYIDYLEKLLPLVRPGGLILAHNMNGRMADPNYVKAITTNPDLETLILLREGAGVGVTLKKK
jgi:predicted O-methyltransferase YrrM